MVLELEYDEALLDSGATHSVVGDTSLLTALRRTNIALLVASSHQFLVDYIGDIALNMSQECISGPNLPPPINLSTFTVHNIERDMSELWHQRLGHLSIRKIKQIMQFKAADGIPNFDLDNIKICHSCSIAKAEHWPFISALQKHIGQPGDVIAADLVGPLPISIDGKRYALIIQDIFPRLMEIIALYEKSEAKNQLRLWMVKFMTMTKLTIRIIRTNKGAEFCTHFFHDYLKEKGITH
ncbi:hypothetical protein O181_107927 [Austropuccinia psidii MF-1]|uniref:Integrase catalytic domain-containing protein n=1 Tax=Austropuccinia psidii MF-1 TaxID=1389203 RepID=A0A9Q3JT97_9BASI|nr:hypothetical protein [Austropuccinia psidii MF-1]